jgi:GMP synthase-like glutamine amidotransferase
MSIPKAKLAILDMNNGVPNQGLRCIREIVEGYEGDVDWKIFDVRGKNELPDLSYDIYISSGGPGSPLEEGPWRQGFFNLIDAANQLNKNSEGPKKYFFFICYSFQVACHHFELGDLTLRQQTSFGVFPVHKTRTGVNEPILKGLANPYFVVDSRDWQVVQPRLSVFEEHGAHIISLEKIRTHVEYERAIMAVRFTDEFVGTQFHPEADAEGMMAHFSSHEIKHNVIAKFSMEKYYSMMRHMSHPDKIAKTHSTILPNFISVSLAKIKNHSLVLN